MKRKVGIITLNGYFNYGNRLQNYALEQLIHSLGFEPETALVTSKDLAIDRHKLFGSSKLSKIKNRSLSDLFRILKNKLRLILNASGSATLEHERNRLFIDFSNEYLHEVDFAFDSANIQDLTDHYEYFVVGSDQVWNPNNTYGSPIYFLRFVDQARRVAYAPSISTPSLPDVVEANYSQWIKEFSSISVREDDGARLIEELTGLKVPVLSDPTLVLGIHEWEAIAKEASNKPQGKYICTYFLGGVPREHQKWLQEFSTTHGYDVINLGDIYDRETYQTGPSEFIDYIKDCSILLTDSFHGCVFSILFKRPFVAYKRLGGESMYSRIDTLLARFSLENRKYENMIMDETMFEINYDRADAVIETEQKRSLDFLRKSFTLPEV